MIKILDRYLLVEIGKIFLAIVSILVVIIFSTTFIKLLQLVSEGSLGNNVIWQLAGLELLKISGQLIPPAFFLSILFTIGRMYRDSEVTAMFAGGLGVFRIFRGVFLAAIPITLLVGWLTLVVLPDSKLQIETIKQSQKDVAALVGLSSGRFHEFQNGKLVVFLGEFNKSNNFIKDVFIRQYNGDSVSVVTATSGSHFTDEKNGDRIIELRNGNRYEGIPGTTDFSVGQFEKYRLRIASENSSNQFVQYKARPSAELWESDDLVAQGELQYRFMAPIAVLVFTFVSIPFSRSSPRQSMYGRLVFGIAGYFVYLNIQKAAENWMVMGITPAFIGIWWVPVITLILASLFVLHDNGVFRQWWAKK